MPSQVDDAQRWRTLATEAHAVAAQLIDPEARRIMLSIAAGYEGLAKRADARKKMLEH